MESFTSHEEKAAALAAGVISELVGANAVWCFGVRSKTDGCAGRFFPQAGRCETVHLYLLVFADAAEDGCEAVVAGLIGKKSEGKVTATVLVYRVAGLARVKGNHRHFLGEVLASGTVIFRKEGYAIPEFVTASPDDKAKMDYWNHCRYMAICCLEAETAIENPNAEPVQAALLHQAAEQVCLGLVYVFLGCRPNYFALGYLLELCELFLPDVADLFPRRSAEEQKRFAVLELRMESLRYRLAHPGITDIEVLRSRVHELLKLGVTATKTYFAAEELVLCDEELLIGGSRDGIVKSAAPEYNSRIRDDT